MSVQAETYSFDGLPIADVDGGTNLLVTGPALGGIRELVLRMLLRQHAREGVLLLAADTAAGEALDEYEALGGELDAARVGAIDCTGNGVTDGARNVRSVGSPSDLTGIGIEFASLYEQLRENGATQVRTGVYTLSPFVMYAEAKSMFRFVHTLTARIRTAGGLGVCAVDPEAIDGETLSSLAQAFDARVALRREAGEAQLRVRGPSAQTDDWQSISLPE